MLKDEIKLPENEDKIVRIGRKEDEIYLNTILGKISQYDCVYILTVPIVPKLLKIQEYYEDFKNLGIAEDRFTREKIRVPNLKDPDKMMELIIIKWRVIPRLLKYREEIAKEIEDF